MPKVMSQAVRYLRYLRTFANYRPIHISIPHYQTVGYLRAYGEQNISQVHDTQDDITDLRLVKSVAGKQQRRRKDVVCEHQPMILAALFDVDDKELLQPEGDLYEVVPFDESSDVASWKVGPHFAQIGPVR
jgi:hypothetical protein